MCKGAVAAPRPLQALVYPILQEKSLPFCEKIKKSEILNEKASDCFKDSGSGIAAHGHTFIAVGKGDLQRMPRCVQGAVLVFGQRNPGFRKTDLLRLEGFKVAFFLWSETGSMGTGIEPVMIPRLAVHPDGEIVQNIPVFGNATERQLGGCVIAVLHGKVDRQIVRRDLGEQITAPETGKYDAAHRRQDGAFHRPGGVFGAVTIREQVAGKCLALPAVKQREAPGCRVNARRPALRSSGCRLQM